MPPYTAYSIKYLVFFAIGGLVQFLLVCTIKVTIGRLRPDFIGVCRPSNASIDYCREHPHAYLAEIDCGNDYREVRMSFPSGHASWSLYIVVCTCVYLHYRAVWRLCSSRAVIGIAQLLVITGGLLVCVSRVTDYQHFIGDVLAGSAIGAGVATVTVIVAGVVKDAQLYQGLPHSKHGRI